MPEQSSVNQLLSTFPRKKPPLPPEYQAVYEQECKINRGENDGLLYRAMQEMEAWEHRKIVSDDVDGPLLELGPGRLNHVKFEEEERPYDIVEPFDFWYRDNPLRSRLRNIFPDVMDIPIPQNECERYGRIFSVGVLEHICNLPSVIARSGLLLKESGAFQAGLPSEGGALWGLAWRCTTGILFRIRTGMNYKMLMRHEHINESPEIIDLIRHFFEEVHVERFPTPLHHVSFYAYVCARKPRITLCRSFLTEEGCDVG